MKKACFILLLIPFIWACSKEKLLQKEWVVTGVEFINKADVPLATDSLEHVNLQNITHEVLKNVLMNNIYLFNKDHTCEISANNTKSVFKYKLVKGGKYIAFSNLQDNTTNEVEVALLTADTLIIVTHNDQTSLTTKLILTTKP
jgi:hypothetical protein